MSVKVMSQTDAVFMAVTEVLKSKNIEFKTDETDAKALVKANDLRKPIIAMLIEIFKAGAMEIKSDKARQNISNYCGGLLTNHLRKDNRLNGGQTYRPTYSNPGHGDPVIKNLKAFKATIADASKAAVVQAEIDRLVAEKAKAKIEVNLDILPEHLRKLVA